MFAYQCTCISRKALQVVSLFKCILIGGSITWDLLDGIFPMSVASIQ